MTMTMTTRTITITRMLDCVSVEYKPYKHKCFEKKQVYSLGNG